MLYPSIFGENLFDDFFRFPDFGRDVEKKLYGKHAAQVMKLSLIHISEPTRLLSISYAVFCLKKKKKKQCE